MDVRYHFLRELKEANIVRVQWVSTNDNCTDMFTKTLPGPAFAKVLRVSPGEGVRVKQATGHDSTVPKGPGTGVGSADKYTVNGRGTTGKRVSWQDPVESCTV